MFVMNGNDAGKAMGAAVEERRSNFYLFLAFTALLGVTTL